MQFTIRPAARSFTPDAATTPHDSGHARSITRGSVALWTLQGTLALLFLFAGGSKLVMSNETLTQDTWLPALFLRFIGLCELLGAIGLVLPAALRIRTELTPLAAAGLVVIMIGATVLTVAAGDPAPSLFPFAMGILLAVVAGKRSRSRRTVRTSRIAGASLVG